MGFKNVAFKEKLDELACEGCFTTGDWGGVRCYSVFLLILREGCLTNTLLSPHSEQAEAFPTHLEHDVPPNTDMFATDQHSLR